MGDPMTVIIELRKGESIHPLDWIGLYPTSIPSLPGLSHKRWRYVASGEMLDSNRFKFVFQKNSPVLPNHAGFFEFRIHLENSYGAPNAKSHEIHFLEAPISTAKRWTLFAIFLAAVYVFQSILNSRGGCPFLDPETHTDSIYDWLSELTRPINKMLLADSTLAEGLQALSSFILDAGVLTLIYCATMRRSSVRSFVAVFLLFALRFLAQVSAVIPCPPGFIWPIGRVLGVPIPTVFCDYHNANDFFFSGHTGTAAILSLEFFHLDYVKLSYFYACATPWIAIWVVSCRVHRGIDCLAALLAAITSSSIAKSLAFGLDRWLQVRRREGHETRTK